MSLQPWMVPADLAPGDAKSLEGDWSQIELHRVSNAEDPFFGMAFGALWEEFGSVGEIEHANVLARRMQWNPSEMKEGRALYYEMVLATVQGKFAAVRDHTAIVLADTAGAIVHMSHNLVAPQWRRSGLAGWFRAYPVTTARRLLAAQKRSADSPITLAGEMERFNSANPASCIRLAAYEKAGYKKIDPQRVHYLQPDFRSPAEIDRTGGPRPIPLCLIIRRVGREDEQFISGLEVRQIALALYKMYGAEFRARDMTMLYAALDDYPAENEMIPLLPPAAV